MERKKLAKREEIDNNLLFENLKFQSKVREGYLKPLDIFPEIIFIDGHGTEEEVHQRVVQAYESWLEGRLRTLKVSYIELGVDQQPLK